MRPHQWTKNALVFAGIVFDGQLFVVESLLRILAAFALLCAVSSAIYLMNDLIDVESDRRHTRKRHRPIASGALPIPLAIGAAVVLGVIALVGGFVLSFWFGVILILYVVNQILYSTWLKHIVLMDIMAVTAGFVMRVAAGVVVIAVQAFSPWLYACAGLLSLFLVIGKRRGELIEMGDSAALTRASLAQYTLPLLDDMLRLVISGTLITYIVYVVEAPSILLAGTNLAIITVPFVIYAIFRYLYLINVRGEGSAPDELLLRDRPMLISIALWGIVVVAILYLPRVLS